MEYKITLHVQIDDEETLEDFITILETTVPYIADNVVVTSEKVEEQIMTPITVGMQVVVNSPEDSLMGTIVTTTCPVFEKDYPDVPGMHILIEGDLEPICFPAEWVVPYIDIYNGMECE